MFNDIWWFGRHIKKKYKSERPYVPKLHSAYNGHISEKQNLQ